MKSAPFTYERPNDISGVLALMAMPDVSTKIMAGGQSLGPMLNLRLAAPDVIVDITALSELKRADTDKGDLVLGACVTHADIEDGQRPTLRAVRCSASPQRLPIVRSAIAAPSEAR